MNLNLFLFIAGGGAIGALARYGLSNRVTHWLGHGFPYGTLVVNVLGSFLLGVLAELLARVWDPSPELRDAIRVGFIGAFTTFSTFSLDLHRLVVSNNDWIGGAIYVTASVVLGVLALIGGLMATRMVLA